MTITDVAFFLPYFQQIQDSAGRPPSIPVAIKVESSDTAPIDNSDDRRGTFMCQDTSLQWEIDAQQGMRYVGPFMIECSPGSKLEIAPLKSIRLDGTPTVSKGVCKRSGPEKEFKVSQIKQEIMCKDVVGNEVLMRPFYSWDFVPMGAPEDVRSPIDLSVRLQLFGAGSSSTSSVSG